MDFLIGALNTDHISDFWNELLQDNSFKSEFDIHYPSRNIFHPDYESKDAEKARNSTEGGVPDESMVFDVKSIYRKIAMWNWRRDIDLSEMKYIATELQVEQLQLCDILSKDTLSHRRLHMRGAMTRNYFQALSHKIAVKREYDINAKKIKPVGLRVSLNNEDEVNNIKLNKISGENSTNESDVSISIASFGARVGLQFALSFLRRAWRCGDDDELCTELLEEIVQLLKRVQSPGLFDEQSISQIWMEITVKASNFLKLAVLNEVSSVDREIPIKHRSTCLDILLELSIQKGTVSGILEVAQMLLQLSDKSPGFKPALVKFLKRYKCVLRSAQRCLHERETWLTEANNMIDNSPPEQFLRFLELPTDEKTLIEPKLAATVMIAFLNRMAKPYLHLENLRKDQQNLSLDSWGWLSWEALYNRRINELLHGMKLRQFVCTQNYLFFINEQMEAFFYDRSSSDTAGTINPLPAIRNRTVKYITAHVEGSHYLALTTDGMVYSWGNGDFGVLGHGDKKSKSEPTLIKSLVGKLVVKIACGVYNSAAITTEGELFMWGYGVNGKLGDGTDDASYIPKKVSSLKGLTIVDVACGGADGHVLALTDRGLVLSWGSDTYGKLGREIDPQKPNYPEAIEYFRNNSVSKIYVGGDFSAVITKDGRVFTWGCGDNYRLGHDGGTHYAYPKQVEALMGVTVIKLAVGVEHCLAIAEGGDIYAWGNYRYAFPLSCEKIVNGPTLVKKGLGNVDATCGIKECILWSRSNRNRIDVRSPYITDISENGFRTILEMLEYTMAVSGENITEELESIIVSVFNILRLQFFSMTVNDVPTFTVGLQKDSKTLNAIKLLTINVAFNEKMLPSIQVAARNVLVTGSKIMFQSMREIMEVLNLMSPITVENLNNTNEEFSLMNEKLLWGLLGVSGFYDVVNIVFEEELKITDNSDSKYASILFKIISLLLHNCEHTTVLQLKGYFLPETLEEFAKPNTATLILQFQRFIFGQLYSLLLSEDGEWIKNEGVPILGKYLEMVMKSMFEIMKTASCRISGHSNYFCIISNILTHNGIDLLLIELASSLIGLQEELMKFKCNINCTDVIFPFLTALDDFNKRIPWVYKEDIDNLSWPGISVNGINIGTKIPDDMPVIRKADVENHNKDGGLWFVYNNKVYDIQDRCQTRCEESSVLKGFFTENSLIHNPELETDAHELLNSCFVTNYLDTDEDLTQYCDKNKLSTITLDVQRMLLQMLSNRLSFLRTPSVKELNCLDGYYPLDQYMGNGLFSKQEHDYVYENDYVDTYNQLDSFHKPNLIYKESMIAFQQLLAKHFKQYDVKIFNVNIELDNPLAEFCRLLLAVFVKHLALGPYVKQSLLFEELSLPFYFEKIARCLYDNVCKIMKKKQKHNQTYEQVCKLPSENCRFLLQELKPFTSDASNAIENIHPPFNELLFKKYVMKHMHKFRKLSKMNNWDESIKPNLKEKSSKEDSNLNERNEKSMRWEQIPPTKPGNIDLICSLTKFVFDKHVDLEEIREGIKTQYEKSKQRKEAFETMLTLMNGNVASLPSMKYHLICGWLSVASGDKIRNRYSSVITTPQMNMELCIAKGNLIRRVTKELREHIRLASALFTFDTYKSCTVYSQRRMIWVRLLMSGLMLLTDMIENSDDMGTMINDGIFSTIEFLCTDSGILSSNSADKGIRLLHESFIESPELPSAAYTSAPPDLVKFLKAGVKVKRGPNWKWGTQDGGEGAIGTVMSPVNSDGWVRIMWDCGFENTYRMGNKSKFDIELAPKDQVKACDRNSFSIIDKSVNEGTPISPYGVLRACSVKFVMSLLLHSSLNSENFKPSTLRNLSSYLRYISNKRSTHILPTIDISSNWKFKGWTPLSFVKTVTQTEELKQACCTYVWFDLLSKLTVSYNSEISVQIQAIRMLSNFLSVESFPDHSFRVIMERIFLLVGNNSLMCVPDILFPMEKGDKKTIMPSVASQTSAVVEEFIELCRRLLKCQRYKNIIQTMLMKNVASATKFLSCPTSAIERLDDKRTVDICSLHTGALLTIGGLEPKPCIGSYVIDHKGRSGYMIKSDSSTALIYVHELRGVFGMPIEMIKDVIRCKYKLCSKNPDDETCNILAKLVAICTQMFNQKSDLPIINLGLLRYQQVLLAAINAARVTLDYPNLLKIILKKSVTNIDYQSPEPLNERIDNDESSRKNTMLIHKLMANAVKPSPLKANFTRKELQEAAVTVSQYLAIEDLEFKNQILSPLRKRGLICENDTGNTNDQLVKELMSFGFSEDNVQLALRDFANSDKVTSNEIVEWLLDQEDKMFDKNSVTKPIPDNTGECWDMEYATDNGEENQQSIKRFKKLTDFTNVEEYAEYVEKAVTVGTLVRCCKTFQDEVFEGDVGTVIKINKSTGLHDLNLQVHWQVKGCPFWIRYAYVELITHPNEPTFIKVGDTVKVRASVTTPHYKWGSVTHNCIGTVTGVSRNFQQVTVNFPQQSNWVGRISEMEVLPPHHMETKCNGCERNPIIGPRMKCKVCENFNLCEKCFYTPKEHLHSFVRINEPGSAAIFAGKPKKVERLVSSAPQDELIEDHKRCIKHITTSSMESNASRLLVSDDDSYWQSSSDKGQHWIRIEMHDNVTINMLRIKVDPTDGSYMPYIMKVYVGGSFEIMQEIATVKVLHTDTNLTLLSDISEFYPCVEIVVKQCQNSGINCKIRGIQVIGKKKAWFDLPNSSSFLALGYKDPDDYSVYLNQNRNMKCAREHKVFAWGLNDKDQLGGLRGTKVKIPTYSETLSAFRPTFIIGGSKTLFIISHDGKLFACGDGEDGRLGLGPMQSSSVPRQVTALNQYVVKKVAVHSGGKHALALTSSGKVFSWGDGEHGKLGHGNKISLDRPRFIEFLKYIRVKEIACGSSYSAAITTCGELYTWGLGSYGRLGHGDTETQTRPKLVKSLLGKNMIKVACGSRDAQTLALDINGDVYSWGDGDFGKLGRGGNVECRIPTAIEYLSNKGVVQIECGAQFSLALTKSGQVFTWGKGDFYRLGLGTESHAREPTLVEGLHGIHITHVAVGALHSLVVSNEGSVYAWGDNDHGQQGDNTTIANKVPVLVNGFRDIKVNRVACGSSHSIAWQCHHRTPVNLIQPVALSHSYDPFASHSLGISKLMPESNLSPNGLMGSLSKIILTLESNVAKQAALQHVLNALKVIFARDAIVSVLSYFTIEEPVEEEPNIISSSQVQLPNLPDDNEGLMIASGGGEAPAAVIDTDDISVSNQVSPVEEEPQPSLLSSILSSDGGESFKETMTDFSAISVTELEGCTDSFMKLFSVNDARNLVDLLKLAAADRLSNNAKETLSNFLKEFAKTNEQVTQMLMEFCVLELEDVTGYVYNAYSNLKSVVQESSHPCSEQMARKGNVRIPGASSLRVEFDKRCSTEEGKDTLTISDPEHTTIYSISGRETIDWSVPLIIQGDELKWEFKKDEKSLGWGWRFTVYPINGTKQKTSSDRDILSQPSFNAVTCLLEYLPFESNAEYLKRTVTSLSCCVLLSNLDREERTYCVEQLYEFIKKDRNNILKKNLKAGELDESPLINLFRILPKILLQQYDYEYEFVKKGEQLMYSPYLKALLKLSCILEVDVHLLSGESDKWTWVRHYCAARRICEAIINQTKLPEKFCKEVREITTNVLSPDCYDYESHELFSKNHDEQLLCWLKGSPEEWVSLVGTKAMIYGWGHNHRGQLGGLLGSQVREPTLCETLTALKPIQLAGGEQTVFALTPAGRIFTSGYADKGRLGIGPLNDVNPSNPYVNTPRMIESLSLVSICKVAVHSGGRHCLALATNGFVYAWGDGEGGRLGIGNVKTHESPTIVETLKNKNITDVACGGAHSAAISKEGKLYTWGRGAYGRLGHGNCDNQFIPKLVEALNDHQVVDVACGSGDAHTLCITSDGLVWSWGDGDYGKLGRGGSDRCFIPMKIEAFTDIEVIKVECGSQFSVALTGTGHVYTWGKGDYYRLGHSTDDHVRIPKRIDWLHDKKVVCISTGSLHVVACTNEGEVFAWGDNDEGQLGDGTLKPMHRPRVIVALQGKKVSQVVCGSAHTFAKCDDIPIPNIRKTPLQVPIQYSMFQDIPLTTLRNRILLLRHFSEFISPIICMLPIKNNNDDVSLDSLRDIMIFNVRESIFKKALVSTMSREPNSRPTCKLNRIQVKKYRNKSGLAGENGTKSVFGQMTSQMHLFTDENFLLQNRNWVVQFIGEKLDDLGGGYYESISEMCEELQNGSVPLLILTPNGRDESGTNRDSFIFNPSAKSKIHLDMFKFLGILLGIAIRTGNPLPLNIAEPMWKLLVGMELTANDISEIDQHYIPGLTYIRDEFANGKNVTDLKFTTISASGDNVKLASINSKVNKNNYHRYLRLALNYRLHEFDEQVVAVKSGMCKVIPVPLLYLFKPMELEEMVCGNVDIPIQVLQSIAVYKGISEFDILMVWFWEILEEFTSHERSLFLRFTWGRNRLPRTRADFQGRDFTIQVLDKYNPPDYFLPESYTCFFMLKMPRYSCKYVLKERLKYAIYNCKLIDNDEHVRVTMTNDGNRSVIIDNSENSIIDGFTEGESSEGSTDESSDESRGTDVNDVVNVDDDEDDEDEGEDENENENENDDDEYEE